MGFLQDDKEFVEAIKETYDWGSFFLHKFLVTMLLSTSLNRYDHVWRNSWRCFKMVCDINLANEECFIFKIRDKLLQIIYCSASLIDSNHFMQVHKIVVFYFRLGINYGLLSITY